MYIREIDKSHDLMVSMQYIWVNIFKIIEVVSNVDCSQERVRQESKKRRLKNAGKVIRVGREDASMQGRENF